MKNKKSGLIFWLVKSAVMAVACIVLVGLSASISMANPYNANGTYSYVAGSPGTLVMTWTNSDFMCDGPAFPVMTKTVTSITATQMVWLDNPTDTTLVRLNGTAGNITGTWTLTDSTTGSTYSMVFTGTAASGTVSIAGAISSCGSNGPTTITSFSPSSGMAGNLVTINGNNFSPITTNNSVMFNGVPSVVTGVRPGQLFVIVPVGATTGTISVTNLGGTATSGSPFTLLPGTAPATLAWGGVYHRFDSDGTEFDALDVGINSYATSLAGMTVSVAGPNNFNYTFTDADTLQYINGQLTAYKKYVSPASLAPGVYTFTLVDSQGNVSHRVDTHVIVTGPLPQVNSATIQLQRKADGSYRISWAPVNATKTYYYRVRINRNDAAETYIYDSPRAMSSFADVPTGILFDDSTYKVRVEVVDSPSYDLATNRSLSAWKLFSPQSGDYNANRLLTSGAGINNRTDSGATPTFDVNLSVSAPGSVTSISLTGPAGFSPYNDTRTAYDFVIGTDISNSTPNGTTQNTSFYKKFLTGTPMPTGLYTFTYVANGLTHTAYATLTSPVIYNAVDSATMQAQELGNGNIRFSWANVD
ncbi:MAG: IPT/TIG domain-containing protein, partial [Desulfuromonadales bacterium]